MPTVEARFYGDPLTRDPHSADLRQFLARVEGRAVSCTLCLSASRGEASGRTVVLHDGVAEISLRTHIAEPELDRALRAAAVVVSDTAPLVVFGAPELHRQALLEFPEACAALLHVEAGATLDWLQEMAVRLPRERPAHSLPRAELEPLLDLPLAQGAVFLHVGSTEEPSRRGTDLVVRSFEEIRKEDPRSPAKLVVYLADGGRLVGRETRGVEVRVGLPTQEDLRMAVAVVQPQRHVVATDWPWFLHAMAAARPLILASHAVTNQVLDEKGVYLPVGGRMVSSAEGQRFAPDPRVVTQWMREVLEEVPAELAQRGRSHVLRRHLEDRYAKAVPERTSGKPRLVLEAPLFEVSSTSVLTAETARALLRRGRVGVLLRPTAPFQEGLDAFSARYPDLVPALCRRPADVDFWLSAGWPVRLQRPAAHQFGLRIDWEYGALPTGLSPVVTQEADTVVVHSEHVRRLLSATGRPVEDVVCIPHGVDASVFHENAEPLAEVVEFKGTRRAILFVGGLIWRKGFDLVMKSLVELFDSGGPVCLVIKPLGSDTSYRGHNLSELVERVRRFPGAPEILVLDRELSKAEMAGLYRACDLLLHPYRGEGFGMPVLEARCCGLPVVVTRGGSTDDFCNGDACLQISSAQRFVPIPGVHIGRPYVLEPDSSALSLVVKDALERIDDLLAVARREALPTRLEHSWDRAAEHLEQLTFLAASAPSRSRRPLSESSTLVMR